MAAQKSAVRMRMVMLRAGKLAGQSIEPQEYRARRYCARCQRVTQRCGVRELCSRFWGRAASTSEKRQQNCRTPNSTVDILQVGFDGHIGAESLRAQPLQWGELEIRRDGKGD